MKLKKSSVRSDDDLTTSGSDDDDAPLVVKKSSYDYDNPVPRKKSYEDSLYGGISDDKSALSLSSDDDVPLELKKSSYDYDSPVPRKKHYEDSLYGGITDDDSLSSLNNDDDEPLVKKKRWDKDNLYSYSLQRCAICDSVFYNKYNILVHNSQHIIIPLLKLQVHKCSVCNRNFASQETLNHHKETKHGITVVPDLLESIIKKQPVIKCFDDLSELLKAKTVQSVVKKVPEVDNLEMQAIISLESMIKTQPIVKCIDDLAELFKVKKDKESFHKQAPATEKDSKAKSLEDIVKTQAVVKCYDDITELLNAKRKSLESVEEFIESDNDVKPNISLESLVETQPIVKCDNSVTELINNNIRSRLIFEDDIEDEIDDIIMMNRKDDLTTACKDNFGMLNGFQRDSSKPGMSEHFVGKIFLGSKIPGSEAREPSVTNFAPSVHYDELMIPGEYGCNRCSKTFPNRIQAITHEATHMKIVKLRKGRPLACSLCDRFISGNYRNLHDHISEVHPNKRKQNTTLTHCTQCGLKYYNYERHIKNYHSVYGCPCGDRFLTNKELVEHDKTCDKEKKENVENNLCSDNLIQDTYRVVKPCNGDDSRVLKLCELCVMFKCTSHVFKYVRVGELSKVGRRQRCEGCDKEFFNIKLMKQIRRKRLEHDRSECKKTNCNTNENRLKHIQRRLKFMNKLTRF